MYGKMTYSYEKLPTLHHRTIRNDIVVFNCRLEFIFYTEIKYVNGRVWSNESKGRRLRMIDDICLFTISTFEIVFES